MDVPFGSVEAALAALDSKSKENRKPVNWQEMKVFRGNPGLF